MTKNRDQESALRALLTAVEAHVKKHDEACGDDFFHADRRRIRLDLEQALVTARQTLTPEPVPRPTYEGAVMQAFHRRYDSVGTRVDLINHLVLIRKEDEENALAAMRAMPCPYKDRYFAWISEEEIRCASHLGVALQVWGYTVHVSSEGTHVTGYPAEKLGDDRLLWTALAPFVVPQNYLTWQNEHGRQWSWIFSDGKLVEERRR